ncbi:MAG: hypothetical protein JSS37_11570 [Proteobacteria bacterium]|nr:hypothetical protein [Pseudomonadota bacterium]
MSKNVIADSGYWYALFDARDSYHEEAQILAEDIKVHKLLVPWPTLYEAINTRRIRRSEHIMKFKKILEQPTTVLIDDEPYRIASLTYVLENTKHSFSLVDHVIRSMIGDTSLSIDAFVGFNPSDFYDVCDKRGIQMLYR